MLANVGTGIFAQARQGLIDPEPGPGQDLVQTLARVQIRALFRVLARSLNPGLEVGFQRKSRSWPGPDLDAIWSSKSVQISEKVVRFREISLFLCSPR